MEGEEGNGFSIDTVVALVEVGALLVVSFCGLSGETSLGGEEGGRFSIDTVVAVVEVGSLLLASFLELSGVFSRGGDRGGGGFSIDTAVSVVEVGSLLVVDASTSIESPVVVAVVEAKSSSVLKQSVFPVGVKRPHSVTSIVALSLSRLLSFSMDTTTAGDADCGNVVVAFAGVFMSMGVATATELFGSTTCTS